MSVYVDGAKNSFGCMLMCHMIADSRSELLQMANKIGIQRRWIQDKSSIPHFDVCQSKRKLAIAAGAIECSRTEFVTHMRNWRISNEMAAALTTK